MAKQGCAALENMYKELATANQLPADVNETGKSNIALLKRRFSVIDCLKERKEFKEARKVLEGMQADLNVALGEDAKNHPMQVLINQADLGLCLREKNANNGTMEDEERKRCQDMIERNEEITLRHVGADSIHLLNQLHSGYLNKISLGSIKDMKGAVDEIKKLTPLVAKFHDDPENLDN